MAPNCVDPTYAKFESWWNWTDQLIHPSWKNSFGELITLIVFYQISLRAWTPCVPNSQELEPCYKVLIQCTEKLRKLVTLIEPEIVYMRRLLPLFVPELTGALHEELAYLHSSRGGYQELFKETLWTHKKDLGNALNLPTYFSPSPILVELNLFRWKNYKKFTVVFLTTPNSNPL